MTLALAVTVKNIKNAVVYNMETVVLTDSVTDIKKAAAIIKSGGLAAFPTETVYGLGANALDAEAVKKIFQAKGRPTDNPLIIHIAGKADLERIVSHIPAPERTEMLINAFWPGALTLILPSNGVIPPEATGGLDSVAVRLPSCETALALIKAAGVPIAAPSANSSGKPSPTLASHVMDDLNGKIDAVIDGGAALLGLESTVIDMTGSEPCLLRPGLITKEMIEGVIGSINVGGLTDGEKPKSPGLKYKHYAPKAQVILFEPTMLNIAEINRKARSSKVKTGIFTSSQYSKLYANGRVIVSGDLNEPKTIAANLFKALREFDYMGVNTIYAEIIPEDGEGAAIMNRLRKAAGDTKSFPII
jgi:L-threonylcarbamoyladenylate synthase